MGLGNNFTTAISEQLYISNAKEAYQSTNCVNYSTLTLQQNDQFTGLGYTEGALFYLALLG